MGTIDEHDEGGPEILTRLDDALRRPVDCSSRRSGACPCDVGADEPDAVERAVGKEQFGVSFLQRERHGRPRPKLNPETVDGLVEFTPDLSRWFESSPPHLKVFTCPALAMD
jgi:hypothetical protein